MNLSQLTDFPSHVIDQIYTTGLGMASLIFVVVLISGLMIIIKSRVKYKTPASPASHERPWWLSWRSTEPSMRQLRWQLERQKLLADIAYWKMVEARRTTTTNKLEQNARRNTANTAN